MKMITFQKLTRVFSLGLLAAGMVGVVAEQSNATVMKMTSITHDFTSATDPAVAPFDPIDNTANMTGYATSAGSITSVMSAVSAFGSFDAGGAIGQTWGKDPAATAINSVDAALNLDISTSVLNAGRSVDGSRTIVNSPKYGDGLAGYAYFMFSEVGTFETTVAGDGNDFFLVDLGPSDGDSIMVMAVDASGSLIGTGFEIFTTNATNMTTTSWGGGDPTTSDNIIGGREYLFTTNGSNTLDYNIYGLGFDLSDLGVTGGGIAGIAVTDAGVVGTAGLDVLAVGRNSELVVTPLPEPGTMVLMFGAMVAGCVLRRRS